MTAFQVPFLIALALASQNATTEPYYFGEHPLSDVHFAVDYYTGTRRCPALDPNDFFAYMLTPTWWEVAGQSRSNTPSPMTLSRGDDGATLYAPGGAQYRRAFWHTGIGMWQLDDAGDGSGLSVEKFNSITSSLEIAGRMADRYCSNHSYLSIWRPFCACASTGHCSAPDRDRCIQTATNIRNNAPIQEDTSTDSSGGIEMRTCSLPGQAQVFQCFYVKPTVPPAQGYTGSPGGTPYGWISYPDAATLPLAKPFYVYKQWPDGTDSNSYEWRYWMAEDTGFDRDFAARRQYGTPATTKLCWISQSGSSPASCNLPPSSLGLCDVTASRGACGGSCRAAIGQVGASCTTCYSLTLARNDSSGGGLPTASPANSTGCTAGQYVAGESIQLTAYPASGWSVGGWNGTQNDGSTSTTNSVFMPASNRTVTVSYLQSQQNGKPTVTTGGADGITTTSAMLHGTVNPNGLSTSVYFAYGTDVTHSVTASSSQNVGAGTTTVPFSVSVSGLACSTTYTYYAVATNSAGANAGQWRTFTTLSCSTSSAPTINSEWVDGVAQTSAVLHAWVNPNGSPTTAYFQYGTSPATPTSTTPQSIGSFPSPVQINWAIGGLNCGTTYSYNAVGSNSAGINYGVWQTFMTLPCNPSQAPSVNSEWVDSITAGSAMLWAWVDPHHQQAITYFQYGTDPTNPEASTEPLPISGLAEPDWPIGGLSCGTVYSYNAVISSNAGTTFGPWQTFLTGPCGPTAKPAAKDASVDDIASTYATFHASVNPNGAPTAVYFAYAPGDSPSLTGTPAQDLSSDTRWTTVSESTASGELSCGTTYRYETVAYNMNTFQAGFTDWQTFTTAPCAPATSFYTLTPCRLVDTRNPNDPNGPAIPTNEGRTLVVVGNCGIPTTATAISLNITAVNPSADGYLSLYPEVGVPPSTSTINFRQGQVRANNAIVGLNGFGGMTVFCGLASPGAVDYVLDVNGYFQ